MDKTRKSTTHLFKMVARTMPNSGRTKKFSNGHHNIREPRLKKRLLLLAENYNVPQEKSTKRSQMLNLPLPSGERAGQPHYNATRPSKIKVNKTQVTQKN